MRSAKKIIFFAIIIVAVAGYTLSAVKINDFRKRLPPELVRREATMVNPNFLKIISGEFQELLADYLLLKANIINGGEPEKMTDEDWNAVYILYKLSIELDPRFFQTAYYIQGNIAWRKGMAAKAIELLKKSAEFRTWDWRSLWYIGFDYAYLLNNKREGAAYFLKAGEKPNAPDFFNILAARLTQTGGDTLASIAMLKAMYKDTDNEQYKKVLEKRIAAHTGAYQLEQAIAVFKKKFGRRPDSLEELVQTKIIDEMPLNPFADTYYYDAKTGRVDYGSLKQR